MTYDPFSLSCSLTRPTLLKLSICDFLCSDLCKICTFHLCKYEKKKFRPLFLRAALVFSSLLGRQNVVCTYPVDSASKMISRGKFEQVYSFKEPPFVPIVYFFVDFFVVFWIKYSNSLLSTPSSCKSVSPHSAYRIVFENLWWCSMLNGLRPEIINICLRKNVHLNPKEDAPLGWLLCWEWYCHCSHCNLKDKALYPLLGVQTHPESPCLLLS